MTATNRVRSTRWSVKVCNAKKTFVEAPDSTVSLPRTRSDPADRQTKSSFKLGHFFSEAVQFVAIMSPLK